MTDLASTANIGAGDPRVVLAMVVLSLGIEAVTKLRAAWKAHGMDDAVLDQILAEATDRIARLDSADPNGPLPPAV